MTNTDEFAGFESDMNRSVFGTSPDLPEVFEIALAEIKPNPDQPRKEFDEKALKELATSIDNHGLINPITVKEKPEDAGYIIVAGERRYRAHKLLGRETIAAIVTSRRADELSLIENIQREDLNPIEEAEGVRQLIETHDYTQKEAATVIGKARSTVTNLLGIARLPAHIKTEYADNRVAKSQLIEISKLDGEDKQLAMWQQVKNGATVRQTRQKKKARQRTPDEKPPAEQMQDMITAGRGFVRRIERAQKADASPAADVRKELLELRQQIDALIDGFAAGGETDA